MKNLAPSFALAILLFSLSGCQKLLDFAVSHGYPAPVKSLITKIDYNDSTHFVPGLPFTVENNSFTLIYNSAHDPIYAIRASDGTGRPNYIFRYDASGLLTDLIAAYDTAVAVGNISSWHKFTYDANYNIVMDTVVLDPVVVNGQPAPNPNHPAELSARYQYDAQHRMTHYHIFYNTQVPWLPNTFDTTYSYDVHGNLTGIGHDSKVNFNRTSRILQFLNQDYSVNNPKATYTYNKNGLPTTLWSPTGIPLFIIPNEATTFVSAATLTYINY